MLGLNEYIYHKHLWVELNTFGHFTLFDMHRSNIFSKFKLNGRRNENILKMYIPIS